MGDPSCISLCNERIWDISSVYNRLPTKSAGGAAHGQGRRGGGAGRAMQQLQSRGGGVNSNSGVMSEKAAWLALIEDLKKRCGTLPYPL